MPPVLICWPMLSEVDVAGIALETEPAHQYSSTCCCCADGSRGALWHNSVRHGSGYDSKVWHWVPPCRKNGTYWHSSPLTEHLRRQNMDVGSEVVGGAFQQRWLIREAWLDSLFTSANGSTEQCLNIMISVSTTFVRSVLNTLLSYTLKELNNIRWKFIYANW